MAKACTKNSRLMRGAIGGGAGLVVGGAVGLGVAWWLSRDAASDTTPIWVARIATPLVAAAAGVTIAAWNPECAGR